MFKQTSLRLACVLISSVILLTACDDGSNYAPVTEVTGIEKIPSSGTHRVVSGETVYEIAWRYGLDYRYIAARNHLRPPYYLMKKGQLIALQGKTAVSVIPASPDLKQPLELKKKNPHPTVAPASTVHEERVGPLVWTSPAIGRIAKRFTSSHKGINIAGYLGEPIKAAASGQVVYSGDGLRGYGNLIIIKHDSLFLSAYAFNQKLFVHEGDYVRKGQKIAEMGNNESGSPRLHFEIRRAGKPVDPAFYLNQS
jgi:lipoprotein NlpD